MLRFILFLRCLFRQLEVDELNPIVIERRQLLGDSLSYLNQFNVTASHQSIMDSFEESEIHDTGAFGKIYRVQHQGVKMAVKVIQLKSKKREDLKSLKETLMSKQLKHENVVTFLGHLIDFDKKQIVRSHIFMELCRTSLADWFDENEERNYVESKSMFNQIRNGLEYIHSMNIIHRDLKPKNILIDFSGTCKIADFGLSTWHSFEEGIHTTHCGTYTYSAPEQLRGEFYDFKVDIFSFGLILVAIFMKFENEDCCRRALIHIKQDRLLPQMYLQQFQDEGELIFRMTDPNPNNRPEIYQVTLKSRPIKNFKIKKSILKRIKLYIFVFLFIIFGVALILTVSKFAMSKTQKLSMRIAEARTSGSEIIKIGLSLGIGNSCKFETRSINDIGRDQNFICEVKIKENILLVIQTYDANDKNACGTIIIPKIVWKGEEVERCSNLKEGTFIDHKIQVCVRFLLLPS